MKVSDPKYQPKVTLAIQAGGSSSRMGQNKALLPFGGVPLIEFIVKRGKSLTNDILITTNEVEAFGFLQLPLYPDRLSLRGALVGMYTALNAAQRPMVAVIGCDMPFFSPELLAFQVRQFDGKEIDAVIPRSRGGLEPLHGVYRREPCLPAIQRALENETYSLMSWLALLRVQEIADEQIHPFDRDSRVFINLNTPEEYNQAETLIHTDQQRHLPGL